MRRRYISWGLVIFWMMVMFNLSSDNKEASSYKSRQVTEVVQQMVRQVPDNVRIIDPMRDITEHVVRKSGHVLEFFLLTVLVIAATVISGKGRRRAYINALVIPLLFAISDELHQLYTPGRGAQVVDVVIDGIGILGAIVVAMMLYLIGDILKAYQGRRV